MPRSRLATLYGRFRPRRCRGGGRALELAESLGDTEYQLRSLQRLWAYRLYNESDARGALALAEKFRDVAEKAGDPADLLIGDRIIGSTLHFLGDQADARHYIERVLASYTRPVHRSHTVRFQLDQSVVTRATLARILWLQGLPELAASAAQRSVDEALDLDHPGSLSYALTEAAFPIALYSGDLAAVERFAAMLEFYPAEHGFSLRRSWARCLTGWF